MVSEMFGFLNSEQLQKIHDTSLRILEQVGIVFDHHSALKLLKDAGASIDFSKSMARIPPYLVEEAIKKTPKEVKLHARNTKYDLVYKQGKTYAHSGGGTVGILDSDSGALREASQEDLEKGVRLVDALENLSTNRPCVYPKDFPPKVRDIHTMAHMLQNTEKHCNINTYTSTNLEYIIKIVKAVFGGDEELRKKNYVDGTISPTKPLQYAYEDVNILTKYVEHGIPIDLCPCPITGVTTPITLAGALAHQNSSVLAGILLTQLINLGNPVIYTTRIFTMDMHSGASLLGAIETGIMSVGIAQLAKYYGIPSDVYGLGTDSNTLDETTAFEKSLSGLLPALAGANCISGAGMLGSGLIFSLEQLVIDNEILSMILRSIRGIDVEDETLAYDVISEAGSGGVFLSTSHTRDHFKKEHFIRKLASRAVWEKMNAKNITEVAKAEVKKVLAEHIVSPVDKDVQYNVEKILKEAEKNLIK